jgi:hypothetical protein
MIHARLILERKNLKLCSEVLYRRTKFCNKHSLDLKNVVTLIEQSTKRPIFNLWQKSKNKILIRCLFSNSKEWRLFICKQDATIIMLNM